jgi:hypothetical protein
MPSDDEYRCRVCGWLLREPPWGVDGRSPLFDYCPCCGVEFGYQDATEDGARRFRDLWVERGAPWSEPEECPDAWKLDEQLAHVPDEFR